LMCRRQQDPMAENWAAQLGNSMVKLFGKQRHTGIEEVALVSKYLL
jgi:hypothetical protein